MDGYIAHHDSDFFPSTNVFFSKKLSLCYTLKFSIPFTTCCRRLNFFPQKNIYVFLSEKQYTGAHINPCFNCLVNLSTYFYIGV